MADSSGQRSSDRDQCRIRGWTAPEDVDPLAGSRITPVDVLPFIDQQQPFRATSFPQPLNFTSDTPSVGATAMEGPSAVWMRHPHAHGADFAMPLGAGVEQYQGPTNYGGNTTSGANISLTPDFAGGWQPSLRPDYGIMPDALGLGCVVRTVGGAAFPDGHGDYSSTSYDPNFPTTAQTWAPANIRRSLSYDHGRSPPFASGSSMHQAKPATDLLPRSSTAPPVDVRSPGGSSNGRAVGERCRWGGQCQTIITDLTASGINRHLKECHVQPWDDRSRGYCQWEGSTCSKKLLYYFGFGKHIASVHLRSTASRCELCGQVLARGDTLDRHVKRFCHGRPPGQ